MKKFLTFMLAAIMLLSLCACGAKNDSPAELPAEAPAEAPEAPAEAPEAAEKQTVTLKVWGSQTDQELIKELCEAFAAEHPENIWEFEYGVVGEADAQARYLEDPAAAADVFSYPDDQIITLVHADALYESPCFRPNPSAPRQTLSKENQHKRVRSLPGERTLFNIICRCAF